MPMPGAESTKFDPFAPLNPYHLLTLYGPHQLRDALSVYSPGNTARSSYHCKTEISWLQATGCTQNRQPS